MTEGRVKGGTHPEIVEDLLQYHEMKRGPNARVRGPIALVEDGARIMLVRGLRFCNRYIRKIDPFIGAEGIVAQVVAKEACATAHVQNMILPVREK